MPIIVAFRKCMDRGCSRSLKKKDEPSLVNTKKESLEEVQELYTGEEIQSFNVYAGNVTFLLCVMMYCTGLPILYPFAFVFYFVNYWMFKSLLLKYYGSTTLFNEDLALYSIGWIKYGLFFHGATTLLMLSNNDLFPISKENLLDVFGLNLQSPSKIGYSLGGLITRMYSYETRLLTVFYLLVIVYILYTKFKSVLLLLCPGCA
jgi:hypothetical protein